MIWLDEPEQPFDLQADPKGFCDLGHDRSIQVVHAELRDKLLHFLARRRHRATVTGASVERGADAYLRAGVFFGPW